MMLFIDNTCLAPYFNLATEEYLLKNKEEDILMIWQNEPSIIIGKNQDVRSEINHEFVEEKKLKVVRRFSGGGAVYHDLGNLNLTFIESSSNSDFNRQTKQMQDFLQTIGINAIADHRHTLTVNGLKISGSAQCVHRQRAMYHATLLFNSDLDNLNTALKSKLKPLDDKPYVQSVRSPVTNIREQMLTPMSVGEFKLKIKEFFLTNNIGSRIYTLTDDDRVAIEKIANNKYSTVDWNFHKKNKLCLDLK